MDVSIDFVPRRITFVTIIFSLIRLCKPSVFPAARFFSIPEDKVHTVTHFLCSIDVKAKKRCSCDTTKINYDWCIDIIWKNGRNSNLEIYLELLENFFLSHQDYDESVTCQPVFPYAVKERSQHVLMKTRYRDSAKVLRECKLKRNDTIPVYSFSPQEMFINKECAGDKTTIAVTIKAICAESQTFNISDIFETHLSANIDCNYRIQNPVINNFRKRNFCPREISQCSVNSIYHNLCKVYYAPICGYKNYHCYLCSHSLASDTQSSITNCQWNYSSNVYTRYVNFLSHPIQLSLFVNSKSEYVIADIDYFFPAKRFLSLIGAKNDQTNLENKLCGKKNHRTCCSCKEVCLRFNSCCMDYLWDKKKPTDINSYIKRFRAKTLEYKTQKCERLVHSSNSEKYYMVTDCMAGSDLEARTNCLTKADHSLNFFLPVIGEDSYLYRNSFCAKCNFIQQYHSVNLTIRCELIVNSLEKDCFFTLDKRKDSAIQSCVNRNCKDYGRFEKNCRGYNESFSMFTGLYCLNCSNDATSCKENRFKTWSWFIRFTRDSQINFQSAVTPYLGCDKDKILQSVFTFLNDRNNDLFCRKNMRNFIPVYVENPNFNKCLLQKNESYLFILSSNSNWKPSDAKNDVMSVLNIKTSEICLYYKETHLRIYRTMRALKYDTLHRILSQYTRQLISLSNLNVSLVISPSYKPIVSTSISSALLYDFIDDRICETIEKLDSSKLSFTRTCDVSMNERKFNSTNLSLQISFGHDKVVHTVLNCKKFYSPTLVSKSNTTVNTPKSGSQVYRLLGPQNLVSNDEFPICGKIDQLDDDIIEINNLKNDIELYISFIGSTISIIFYILTIILTAIFPYLRNFYGKLTMVLVSSLMIGDGMFLSAGVIKALGYNYILSLCQVIGILMHLGLVMALIWNVCIGYYMMVKFTTNHYRQDGKVSTYFIGALSLTIVIMITAISLDNEGIVYIGYGENGVCAPQGYYGRIIFYIIPIAISIFGSSMLLIKIVWKIRQENRKWDKRSKTSGRRNINIVLAFLKITFLLGISEGIGFIQVVDEWESTGRKVYIFNAILSITYTFLRSLRGLFIAIVYLCRKESFQMLKNVRVQTNNFQLKIKEIPNCPDGIEMSDKTCRFKINQGLNCNES